MRNIVEVRALTTRHGVDAADRDSWFRIKDGKIFEHWATRDDLGQARQLGWLPPSPGYLIRSAVAKRQALRAARRSRR